MPTTGPVEYQSLGVMGAEISGVNLSEGLTVETIRALREILLDRGLLLLRRQQLSDSAFVQFARYFGVLERHSLKEFAPADCMDILILSNRVQDGKPVGLVEVGHFWHSDGSFLPELDMFTTLYGIEIPHASDHTPLGDTLFTSATAAYEDLAPSEKDRLNDLHAVFSYDFRFQQRIKKNPTVKPARAKSETKDQVHPVIRRHPITGKKAIFVNEGYTSHIQGLPRDKSSETLRSLLEHVYSEKYLYRHSWQPGDVLIWDNNSTQHFAVGNYSAQQTRLMKRITIKSEHDHAIEHAA